MRIAACLLALVVGLACENQRRDVGAGSDSLVTAANASQQTGHTAPIWQVRPLAVAPARFRPGGWSDEFTLWGLVRGRVTKLDTRTGAVSTLPQNGWSFFNGTGVASWRNEKGTWMQRDGRKPILLAGPEPDLQSGFDGPPTVLWSTDGSRALLAWRGEWDFRYRLLERDGAFSSPAGAVVVLLDTSPDSAKAVLVSGFDTTELGRVSRDTEPAFSPSGRRGALRTGRGVVIFEPG
jgi:hypothetical protein